MLKNRMKPMIICPVCNGDVDQIFRNKHGAVTQSGKNFAFSVMLCSKCGFVFLKEAYLSGYEKKLNSIYKVFDKNNYFSFPSRKPENILARDMIIRNINCKTPNILEIGSNRGDLLYIIKELIPNANLLGIDPVASGYAKVPTIKSFFSKSFFSSKFDCIIMQHSLEHIPYPKKVLDDVFDLLEDNGILYIEVPNLRYSLEVGVDDFMPEHVGYFELETLRRCAKRFYIKESYENGFLHVIFAKKQETITSQTRYLSRPSCIKKNILEFINKSTILEREFLEKSSTSKRVVFYGVSYYFRSIFAKFKSELNFEKCYFKDDSYIGDKEKVYGLQKIDSFMGGDLIVVCANNYGVQNKMLSKIPSSEDISVLIPWSRIINFKDAR